MKNPITITEVVRLIRKAKEEVSNGDPEKAEAYLDMALQAAEGGQ
jgi:hypothetical protein